MEHHHGRRIPGTSVELDRADPGARGSHRDTEVERGEESLQSVERLDPPLEFRFTLADRWSRKRFLTLLRRYDLKPYRYRGQRRTTVMVKTPKPFVHETLCSGPSCSKWLLAWVSPRQGSGSTARWPSSPGTIEQGQRWRARPTSRPR